MNIDDVKRKIAENSEDVANHLLIGLSDLSAMRWWFQAASHNARVAVPAAARREMKARHRDEAAALSERQSKLAEQIAKMHRAEAAALSERHRAEAAAFDPERVLEEHIAREVNVDVASIPDLSQGFTAMDDYERQLWAEYRGQGR